MLEPPFATEVRLRPGTTTEIVARPPAEEKRRGRFVGWEHLPEWLFPTAVRIQGPLATVDSAGGFEVRGVPPWPVVGDLWVRGRMALLRGAVAVQEGHDGTLELRLRPNAVAPISLEIEGADVQEELLVELWVVEAKDMADLEPPFGSMQRRLGLKRSLVIPATTDEVAVGCVRRLKGNGEPGALRGFFEATAGTDVHTCHIRGRTVEFVAPERRPARVTEVVASWISHAGRTLRLPLGRVASDGTVSVWCPDDLKEILIVRGTLRRQVKLGNAHRVILPRLR